MILFLTLVLLFLMITIGGERGAVSIMALAGNIIILFFFGYIDVSWFSRTASDTGGRSRCLL